MSNKSPRNESTFGYLARRRYLPDPRPPTKLLSQRWAASSMGHTVSQRLPHLLREKALDIGKTDKVFASEWITEEEVVVGTKCNKVCALLRRKILMTDICVFTITALKCVNGRCTLGRGGAASHSIMNIFFLFTAVHNKHSGQFHY